MKKFVFTLGLLPCLFAMQSCITQQFATVVERDKDRPCDVRIVMQVGIDGTDADVVAVRDQLEDCYSIRCRIPCDKDSTQGCNLISNVIVKKWSALTAEERKSFHHITMKDSDGVPSNAHIGKPNAEPSWGEWRRKEDPRTYCHELLHICGLADQYCSRKYNAVTGTSGPDVSCTPPPDPTGPGGSSCCTATASFTRCGQPCDKHKDDLMATLDAQISCGNILEIVKGAGLNSCPEECCKKPQTTGTDPGTTKPRIPIWTGEIDSTKPVDQWYKHALKMGGTFDFGYAGLYTEQRDVNPVDKETWHGPYVGLAFDVEYDPCEHWTLDGRLRLFEFEQPVFKQSFMGTSTRVGYQFFTLGLDVMAEYEFYKNLQVTFGPGITFNYLTQFGSSFNGYKMEWNKFNSTVVKPNVVNGGFNVGFKYNIPVGDKLHVEPFINTYLPFNSRLKYTPSPKDYWVMPFNLAVGASFMVGVR